MRSWRRQVVRPTLMFSEAGVMVEAYEDHMFGETSPPLMVGRYREIPPPRGAAVCAIQFVHTIGATFDSLHTYKLQYYASQQATGLLEDYLSPNSDNDLKMRAVSIGAESLNRDQRRVICSLLSKSDPDAWQASSTFRQLLEK